MGENLQFMRMLAAARERLTRHDPTALAARAGAAYENGLLRLESLGQTVTVRLPDCAVTPQLPQWQTLVLLHYLELASGAQLTGELMPFAQYPGGLARGGGFDREAENVLREKLGGLTSEELTRRSRALGAEIVRSNADLCARFLFAPRYPIWLKLWFADEELPASGRLLLDTSAPQYLTIEDAVTAGTILLDALTSI